MRWLLQFWSSQSESNRQYPFGAPHSERGDYTNLSMRGLVDAVGIEPTMPFEREFYRLPGTAST
jgi:hypothetical protein